MSGMISYKDVERKVLKIRGEKVILDKDVAELYGVETMRVNEAVKRNPDKFPEGYLFTLSKEEKAEVVKIFDHLEGDLKYNREVIAICDNLEKNREAITNCDNPKVKFSPALPKAFTEKGLYMLATILKSPAATQTTIAIVETFAKLRELSGVLSNLPDIQGEAEQKALLRRSGEIIGDILDSDALEVIGDETTLELDLALVKIKHSVKRGKQKQPDIA